MAYRAKRIMIAETKRRSSLFPQIKSLSAGGTSKVGYIDTTTKSSSSRNRQSCPSLSGDINDSPGYSQIWKKKLKTENMHWYFLFVICLITLTNCFYFLLGPMEPPKPSNDNNMLKANSDKERKLAFKKELCENLKKVYSNSFLNMDQFVV